MSHAVANLLLVARTWTGVSMEVESQGVRVECVVQAGEYFWNVSNAGADPITGVEFGQHASYKHEAPDGWEIEKIPSVYRATAGSPAQGIRHYESGDFSLRVSSKGAVLTTAPVRVGFQTGKWVTVGEVWAPGPEPVRARITVAVTLVVLVLLHALVQRVREHRVPR